MGSAEGSALALAAFVLVIAPFVGSFVGLLIKRLPDGENIVLGRSRCPHCKATLGMTELLPIVSWFIQRGRCRRCGAPLGWFYPMIELGAFAMAIWSVLVVPVSLLLPTVLLGWSLLALSFIDWRQLVLPDVLTLPLISAGLIVALVVPGLRPLDHAVGTCAGFLSMAALALLYRRLTHREGLGLGDAKLFAAGGAWIGWQGLPSLLLIGAASGLLVVLLMRILRPMSNPLDRTTAIAFGPFLSAGIWLVWLYGPIS